MKPFESDLLRFLRKAKSRPGMYFGTPSAERISLVIQGWILYRLEGKDEVRHDHLAEVFQQFHDFVAGELGGKNDLGWPSSISRVAASPEQQCTLFYELLEAFVDLHRGDVAGCSNKGERG
ncbi:MAG: hypothetical protein BM560_01475 [Roseobacter sp. MedPE-SWde]|nr:MAG: hypothetical protein BM560_01475 [Roseobacter sp. MedPE-SWde]